MSIIGAAIGARTAQRRNAAARYRSATRRLPPGRLAPVSVDQWRTARTTSPNPGLWDEVPRLSWWRILELILLALFTGTIMTLGIIFTTWIVTVIGAALTGLLVLPLIIEVVRSRLRGPGEHVTVETSGGATVISLLPRSTRWLYTAMLALVVILVPFIGLAGQEVRRLELVAWPLALGLLVLILRALWVYLRKTGTGMIRLTPDEVILGDASGADRHRWSDLRAVAVVGSEIELRSGTGTGRFALLPSPIDAVALVAVLLTLAKDPSRREALASADGAASVTAIIEDLVAAGNVRELLTR
ncbi:MAG: hypothetical protein Q4G67_06325 [Actinomycetia bacterium]|nr:hypothetical protein [Actinomycetes bacterium]